jgi:hypothetical protein
VFRQRIFEVSEEVDLAVVIEVAFAATAIIAAFEQVLDPWIAVGAVCVLGCVVLFASSAALESEHCVDFLSTVGGVVEESKGVHFYVLRLCLESYSGGDHRV